MRIWNSLREDFLVMVAKVIERKEKPFLVAFGLLYFSECGGEFSRVELRGRYRSWHVGNTREVNLFPSNTKVG